MVYRESETRDWRESIREFRESSEKIAEGLAELEKFRGVQRCLVCHVSSIREAQKQGQDNRTTGVCDNDQVSPFPPPPPLRTTDLEP